MNRSAHVDTFCRDNLPPRDEWPDFRFALPELQYPDRLNCATELLDRWLTPAHRERPCLISPPVTLSYGQTATLINRIANVLVHDLGIVAGNRVLLRGPNSVMLAAAYLAIMKMGGVAVATMPLLRARELAYPITKADVTLALCDARFAEDMERAKASSPSLKRIVYWGGSGPGSLEELMNKPGYESFAACNTASDDVCLIAFTSGTTGEPKGTMHFHRDVMAVCDAYGRYVLRANSDDRFIGTPPLAFTFGLGGLLLFPLHVGASTVLLEKASPDELLANIAESQATICFTAPTAYRAMLSKLNRRDIVSLRKSVSAGETLPKATFEAWRAATGIAMQDGLGSTEMLHVFVCSREEDARAGATGKAIPGYEVRILDAHGNEVPRGTPGRLAVRGPTGCRYLADSRQGMYVQNGWNITGDTYLMDDDGYLYFQARSDDMIISAGYNIAGPEVEAALLEHPSVAECGVVAAPDEERGNIVKAYVVLRDGVPRDSVLVRSLQDFVKETIAPYKYPRAIEFVERLPRTENGKLQRFELRRHAASAAQAPAAGSA
jgi:2-aminobenzoate-CoA ligase